MSALVLISLLAEIYPKDPVALLKPASTPPKNEPVPSDPIFPLAEMLPLTNTCPNEPVPFIPVPLALIFPLAVICFTTKESKYIDLHCFVDVPKSYVIVASGVIIELTSAEKVTESVFASPMYK